MKYKLYIPQWMIIVPLLYQGKKMVEVTHNCNVTYSVVHGVVKELVAKQYCIKEKRGRECHIIFTPKGIKLANSCIEMLRYENTSVLGGK